jgi:hypothetical protein
LGKREYSAILEFSIKRNNKMGFFKKIFGESIPPKKILDYKSTNILQKGLISSLNMSHPTGKRGEYEFGDVFINEYNRFGYYCFKVVIVNNILNENKVYGTNENGQVIPFSHILRPKINSSAKHNFKYQYKDRDNDEYILELDAHLLELLPLIEKWHSSKGKEKSLSKKLLLKKLYLMIFSHKFIGMDNKAKTDWFANHPYESDIVFNLYNWYYQVTLMTNILIYA